MAYNDRVTKYQKEDVLEAIRGSYGIVFTIAKKLGCESRTAKKLIARWKETNDLYQDEKEIILDLSERQVYKSVLEGDTATAKWILKTIGKERGYYEDTPAVRVDTDEPLNIKFDNVGQLTKEDIERADNIELGGDNGDSTD